jgi:hypothetical protein
MTTTLPANLYREYYGKAGLPLHYEGHLGGATQAAILTYRRYIAEPIMQPAPSLDELRLVLEYCAYFVRAPAWTWPKDELALLRASIEHVKTAQELSDWLRRCKRIGIEPL